ncbi:hypothetical protein D9M68_742600 [compost metagenome]
MEPCGDFLGQRHLRVLRVRTLGNRLLQRLDVRQRLERQQRVPAPHQRVGNAQHLGEHRVRGLCDADVVVLALGHLVHTVETFEQRHRQDALRLLAVFDLQVPAHQQVELLVGAAQLQIALERHRVVALHQRVQELVHADRRAGLETVVEVVALHHARHGVLGRQLDHAHRAQRQAPFAVVADLGARRVQHQAGLLVVGLGVGLDLLGGEWRTCVVAARGVADQAGEVTNEKDHLMPQVLQLAHLVEHHRVADVNVGRRRVQPQLDAQGLPALLRL